MILLRFVNYYLYTLMITEDKVWEALAEVMDPEIPVISVLDLGIIPEIKVNGENLVVIMTPTFSGCPALHFMQNDIKKKVAAKLGIDETLIDVQIDRSRKWTTNLISEKGRELLKNFGLTPPHKIKNNLDVADIADAACPHCGSTNTSMRSAFGSTLCRAMHYCYDCKQAFEQFKAL